MGKLNTVFVHVVYYFDMSNNSLLLLHGNECLTMKDVQCKIGTIRKGTNEGKGAIQYLRGGKRVGAKIRNKICM